MFPVYSVTDLPGCSLAILDFPVIWGREEQHNTAMARRPERWYLRKVALNFVPSMRTLVYAMLLASLLAAPIAGHGADEIRFDLAVLPEFRKYSALLDYPGYAALALENSGLSPSPGTKMILKERGRAIELRNGVVRFAGRKGKLYSYEAGLLVSIANLDAGLTFPVVVDVSSLAAGKITVAMKPPFASLLPAAFNDRLNKKVRLVAGTDTQTKVLAYLDQLTKKNSGGTELGAMVEAILVDAYNSSRSPVDVNHDGQPAREPLLTPDQWMLLITFVSWLLLVSALFMVYLRRQRHRKST